VKIPKKIYADGFNVTFDLDIDLNWTGEWLCQGLGCCVLAPTRDAAVGECMGMISLKVAFLHAQGSYYSWLEQLGYELPAHLKTQAPSSSGSGR
jgi:hypothetical protein